MGCGKSKHDVVTGHTKTIKKPMEAESVKGKDSETMKRQESCRHCGKTNDGSAVVSGDQPETTVDNNAKKPEENVTGGDCGEKTTVQEANVDIKPEEKEPTPSPPVELEPTVSPPVIETENIVTEETVNDVDESVLPIDEQNEEVDDEETLVVEEEKSVDGKNDDDVDIETPVFHEAEESKQDEQTPEATELEVEKTLATENEESAVTETDETPVIEAEETLATENDQSATTETYETPVKEEDKVDAIEENLADATKEVETA
ncbi:unnamed protein product [Cochlearia groenlandica]